jgi:hypothetical protein
MTSIIIKNTSPQNLGWRNVTFPANGEISVDAVLFNKLRNEFVLIYGSCGLVWDQAKLQDALKQFKSMCFSEFEALGIPAVKASVAAGNLSRGDKHELALEWLATEKNDWHIKPLGIVWITAIGSVLGAIIIYLFRSQLGIHL